jgi:antitoxin HicB
MYAINFTPDSNGTLLVSVPDLPWVVTYGTDRDDAIAQAADAIETAIEFLIRERRPVPEPKRKKGDATVPCSAMLAAKVGLHNELLRHEMTRAELARRLHLHRPQVDRLFDIRHASTLDQLERAAEALNARFKLELVGA